MKCVTCPNDARPGQLLCEQCRAYAQELEDLRLRLPKYGRRVGMSFAALALALFGCSGTHAVPCDAHDPTAQVDLAAEIADCIARIEACATPTCVDAVQAECDAYAERRCK